MSSQSICSSPLKLFFLRACSFPYKQMRLLNTGSFAMRVPEDTWRVSRSGRDWSELWATKPRHTHTPSHSCLASPDRDLSAVKAILVCWHVLASPSDISWGLSSLAPSGKRPHGTSKPQHWGCRGLLGPHHAGRSQGLCHNCRRLLDEDPQISGRKVIRYRN